MTRIFDQPLRNSVRATRGDLDLQTSNGGLNLDDVGGEVRGRTTNGGVKLRVPQDYDAHLETGTTNGQIRNFASVASRTDAGSIDNRSSPPLLWPN